jgi:hypothetical protein
LAVDLPAYCDGWKELEEDWLRLKYLLRVVAQPEQLRLGESWGFALRALGMAQKLFDSEVNGRVHPKNDFSKTDRELPPCRPNRPERVNFLGMMAIPPIEMFMIARSAERLALTLEPPGKEGFHEYTLMVNFSVPGRIVSLIAGNHCRSSFRVLDCPIVGESGEQYLPPQKACLFVADV